MKGGEGGGVGCWAHLELTDALKFNTIESVYLDS